MKRNILSAVLGAALATLGAAGTAGAYPTDVPAPASQPNSSSQASARGTTPDLEAAQKLTAVATIARVDRAKRDLVLSDGQGHQFTVHVPDNVKRFDALKAGDRVELDYFQSVGLALQSPEKGAQPHAAETTLGTPTAGRLPGGIEARSLSVTAEIKNIDRMNHTVTLREPGGQLDTITVTDPGLQEKLGQLKVGDRIQATFTQAVAVSITPQPKS